MSDHQERSCTECGSLLHHEDSCPTRSCAVCDYLRDNCVCDTGFKLTPVPVTQVPDEVPECPPEQFDMERKPHLSPEAHDALPDVLLKKGASPGLSTTIANEAVAAEYFPLKCLVHGTTYRNMCPENGVGRERCREVPNVRHGVLKGEPEKPVKTARVSSVSFAGLMGDTPEEAPAEATIVIPEGHGSLADPGPPPIKPDPKRELEEILNPSALPEAEEPQWLRRALEEDKFRRSSPLVQESPDGLLYEVVPQEALRLLAAGASGHVMNHKLNDLVRTGRALTMIARELHALRDRVASEALPAKITMMCGAVVTPAEAYSHELCPKCIALAKPTSMGLNEDGSMKDPAELRGYTPTSWPDPDPAHGPSSEEVEKLLDPLADPFLYAQTTLIAAGGLTGAFAQEHCNIPVGHVEMPCGAILKDDVAPFHTDCTECSDALHRDDVADATRAIRERVVDALEEWDGSEGYIEEGGIGAVTDFIMGQLGHEVLACAFCGETYEGEKPVPRAALAAHVRKCDKHPLKHALDSMRARVREHSTVAGKRLGQLKEVLMSLGLEGHPDDERAHEAIFTAIHALRGKVGCNFCGREGIHLSTIGRCVECHGKVGP